MESVKSLIRDVPDFPKPGILFKDITPVLQNPDALRVLLDWFEAEAKAKNPNIIAGIDARGFIFGSLLASRLSLPFVAVRKAGKLPWDTISCSYDLEYGSNTLEIHKDSAKAGDRVIVVDDLLATGGTAKAAIELFAQLEASVVQCLFAIELKFLKGKDVLACDSCAALVY